MNRKKYSDTDKEQFAIANELTLKSDYKGAIKILEKLINKHEASPVLNAKLAKAYRDIDDYERAECLFKYAVELSPNKEIFSLCLFHCFWDQKKYRHAMDELTRFTENNDSGDYTEIHDELTQKGYIGTDPDGWNIKTLR